ncbi:MAG: cytochrome b/b6 domain-containing protein [candidate division KSB1 bacterium]|nr:cytochrome b/b6 domain-containing protein [candidate division KSB1 bacterium]MDZ7274124.1 cytochrome b/b6 domain-containing protein [candidate division KSB1 bacterium]MDZ7287832.1 cytochrome b/b6 domain-containing protein [candidate division KSB1 bacterium]MDZ7296722.1 cytochrome b/b6 domain-containing protein [candidate division KSB1 bacterium]MDZ7307712.1 cytochrome b/b6 domain-containing protein [candidate division KSB1 bacterium]
MNATWNNNQQYYLRWTRNERTQHWILAVCFIVLAITGFALRYPEAAWVQPLLLLEEQFALRGWIHRIAALVFVGLGIYHVGYMLFTARGRTLAKALLPVRQDLDDFWQNVRFLLGRRSAPPPFDHFSYMEKIEYWALVWGTVVMAITGFLLWFEGLALQFLPLWMMEVLTVIHLYEAWLATLAVMVWHFYSVIFNPEVYPLNLSMIDGRMSEEEMRREHGRELARLQQAGLETAAQQEQEGEKAKEATSAVGNAPAV